MGSTSVRERIAIVFMTLSVVATLVLRIPQEKGEGNFPTAKARKRITTSPFRRRPTLFS